MIVPKIKGSMHISIIATIFKIALYHDSRGIITNSKTIVTSMFSMEPRFIPSPPVPAVRLPSKKSIFILYCQTSSFVSSAI